MGYGIDPLCQYLSSQMTSYFPDMSIQIRSAHRVTMIRSCHEVSHVEGAPCHKHASPHNDKKPQWEAGMRVCLFAHLSM